MASTTIQRTPSSSGSNSVFTMSMWIKRSNLGVAQCLWSNGGSPQGQMSILAGDDLIVYDGSTTVINTNRKFRDVSAWYHIVLTCDAGASGDDKVKLYVNGVLETSFATDNRSSFSDLNNVNQSGQEMSIGSNGASGQYFDGVMSHINLIDGTAYGADTFGSIDATTGEWKIKTSPSVTYGTNGFFLKMEDSSNMDLDSSSNALTFTTNGTLTKSECCPSNVFATWNPLLAMNSSMSLANGNTKATTGNGYDAGRSNSYFSTLGMTKGKYYAEFKVVTAPSAACLIGVGYDLSSAQQGTTTNQYNLSFTNLGFSYNSVGSIGNDGDGWTSTGYDTYTADDYIGIAIDCDNWKLYVSKNGTWQNSGTGFSITADKEYFFAVSDNNGAQVYVYEANFGNGCFGSTQLTGTTYNGADGNGIFKYDPNNITLDSTTKSFKSLSTKGLNA